MAYTANEQVTSVTGSRTPRVLPKLVQAKTLASGSGTIAPLSPMAFNTSTGKWVPWATGGANGTGTISALMGLESATLDGSNDILANLIMAGEVHFDDIPVVGGTLAQLKTAVISDLRSRGFYIQGLADWR